MSFAVTHNTTADASFSTAGATAWNATHTLVSVAPTTITAVSGTVTPASGPDVLYRCTMTGNVILALPTGGSDGDRMRLWFTASGTSYTLTFNGNIVFPTSSALSNSVGTPYVATISSNKKAKVLLEYDAVKAQWELTSFINGY